MDQSDQALAVDPLTNLAGMLSAGGPDDDEPSDESEQGDPPSDEDEQLAGTEEDPEGDEPNESDEQQPKTIKVKLTADDGTESEKQVTLDELKSGYMMQADYTRKTQELARERTEVVQAYTQDVQRFQQEAVQAANQARAVLQAFMGGKSPQEMYALAVNDPAQHAQELARQNMLREALDGLTQQEQQISQQAQARLQQQQQFVDAEFRKALSTGFTQKDLADIDSNVPKLYGFKPEELAKIRDVRIVNALKDAVAFRQLKNAKPEVMKRVAQAAPMPQKVRAPEPQQTRATRELQSKFSSGKATVRDLGAFLNSRKR